MIRRMTFGLLATFVLLLLLSGCRSDNGVVTAGRDQEQTEITLAALDAIDMLQADFNDDEGQTRLILLLSPT